MNHPLQSVLTRFNNFVRRYNLQNNTSFAEDGVLFEEDALVVGLLVPVDSLPRLKDFEQILMNIFSVGEEPRVIHHGEYGLTIDYVLYS